MLTLATSLVPASGVGAAGASVARSSGIVESGAPAALLAPVGAPLGQAGSGDLPPNSNAEVRGTEGEGLRVRAEPNTNGTVQAMLIEGARIQVLEGPVSGDGFRWYRVRYDSLGGVGWVAGQYLVAAGATPGAGTTAGGATTGTSGAPSAGGVPPAAAAAAAPPGVSTGSTTGPGASTASAATSPPGSATAATAAPPGGLALPAPDGAGSPTAPAVVVVTPPLGDASSSGDASGAPPAAAAAVLPPMAPPAAGASPAAGTTPAGAPAGAITTTPGRYARLGGYQSASPEYGMNVFIWGEANTTQRDLDRLRELNFGWHKTLFQWREIEGARKGVFDWREADRVVAESTRNGIKVLARIDFPPEWATGPCERSANECAPQRFEDYADFIRAFTTRYGTGSPIGRVQAIEIWNEPNLAREWGNKPVNEAQAREYVRLLQAAYEAAKSVDPQMSIVTAGLTPTGTQNDEARPDDQYLQWMYDAGGAAYFDVLGAHGAGYKAPPNMSPDDVASDSSYGGHASFSFRRVEQLRDVMVRNGDDAKQVWLLEFGWTSDEVHPAYAWHRVTEEQKAQYIVDAFRWARQNWTPWIGVMMLWNLAAPGWTRNNEEYWWSISNPDGSPRPAYTSLLDARRSGQLP